MKLLKLRLKNLNSLVGEWSIDFEHPDYVANGLFAITGPTGAGKSTLLDAISLALYGRTPRLGVISATANEIMSRDCGECFAEVTFQSTQGTFRAHWSQRRARSKGDGNLQAAKHELTDVLFNKIVTAKRNETNAIIQESVGLDYEQFMRSIMLAQGDFATFLKSDDRVRAGILAKITGTDIYARIGIAVFQRHRSEAEAIQLLDAQTSAIELLSSEEIDELVGKIESIAKQFDETIEIRKKTEAAVHWLERLNSLDLELSRLNVERKTASVSLEVAQPKREMLGKAQRASTLSRSLESLRNLQLKITATEKTLDEFTRGLVELQSRKQVLHKPLEQSKLEFGALTKLLEASRPVWHATHALDLNIANESVILEQARKEVHAISTKRDVDRKDQERLEIKHCKNKAELAALKVYQAENERDADLIATLPILEHLGNDWRLAIEREHRLESELGSVSTIAASLVHDEIATQERLKHARESVANYQSEIDAIELQRSTAMNGRSTEELQSELDSASVGRIAMLEWIRLLEVLIALENAYTNNLEELQKNQKENDAIQIILDGLEHQIEQQSKLIAAYEASMLKDRLIASLQEHRSRLVEGEPCELCGSTKHPWAHDFTESGVETRAALSESKEKQRAYLAMQVERTREFDRNAIRVAQIQKELQEFETKISLARTNLLAHAARYKLDSPIRPTSLEPARQAFEHLTDAEAKLISQQKEANSLLEKVAQSRVNLASLQAELAMEELAVQSNANSRRVYQASQQEVTKKLEEHRISIVSKRAELSTILDRLGEAWSDDWASLLKTLQSRLNDWQDSVLKILLFEREVIRSEGNLTAIASKIEQSNEELVQWQEKLNTSLRTLESLNLDRQKLFGDGNPKTVELELQAKLDDRKIETDRMTAEYETLMEAWQTLDRQVIQMQSTVDADKQTAELQRSSLDDELTSVGFIDIADVEASLRSDLQIEEWFSELKSLEELVRSTTTLLDQRASERTELQTMNLANESMETLRLKLDEIDSRLESLRVERIQRQNRISENQIKTEQLQESQLHLAAQKQKMQRWSALNKLIGSADGNRFRSFAQGITFELLLAYANIQLKKLTDRYLLKKSEEGLGLVVIDHYQSSRPRSAANLSGGESFLVSLALALGLSKLASQNVQIDSLFLDEGFGTLDEETLEEALHTLSNLRQEGKLVGLISHVPALNQQIPIRIEVLKGPMGRSRLKGPGVTS